MDVGGINQESPLFQAFVVPSIYVENKNVNKTNDSIVRILRLMIIYFQRIYTRLAKKKNHRPILKTTTLKTINQSVMQMKHQNFAISNLFI